MVAILATVTVSDVVSSTTSLDSIIAFFYSSLIKFVVEVDYNANYVAEYFYFSVVAYNFILNVFF